MGLKENIEQALQQVLHEREIQEQFGQQKAVEISEKLKFIDQKASQVATPYLNAIKQSNCIPIFDELIQTEKLVCNRGGCEPAHYSLGIYFDYLLKEPNVFGGKGGSKLGEVVDLKNNVVHLRIQDPSTSYPHNPRKTAKEEEAEEILNIKATSLSVNSCSFFLQWDRDEVEPGHEDSESPPRMSNSKNIKVSFKKTLGGVMVEASNWGEPKIKGNMPIIIRPRDLNKDTMEKAIVKLYTQFAKFTP